MRKTQTFRLLIIPQLKTAATFFTLCLSSFNSPVFFLSFGFPVCLSTASLKSASVMLQCLSSLVFLCSSLLCTFLDIDGMPKKYETSEILPLCSSILVLFQQKGSFITSHNYFAKWFGFLWFCRRLGTSLAHVSFRILSSLWLSCNRLPKYCL